jgi:hypothetical protein
MILFDCNNPSKMLIDVKEVTNFEDAPPEFDAGGNLDGTGFGFAPGGKSTIAIVRVFYDWPTLLQWSNIGAAGVDKRLLIGSSAFLIEP